MNDSLFSGPKFNQNIFDIIVRFCTYRIALATDVEKTFLMISVHSKDRDALRFLWVDDVEKASPVVKKLRFTRVVFGVSASPILLNATINHHLQKYHDEHPYLVNTFKLRKSLYVENVTYGADEEDEAYKLYVLSKKVFADGGFNLQKFVTNSPSLQQRIATDEQKLPTATHLNGSVVEEDLTYASNLLAVSLPGSQKVLRVAGTR